MGFNDAVAIGGNAGQVMWQTETQSLEKKKNM